MNPAIETLRLLGALMVLTHHYSYQLSYGASSELLGLHYFHNGVDLFFVITGYLFAPILLGEKRVNAPTFLKRRFFRLYPLYLISLITFTLTATDRLPSLALWIEHAILLQTLPYHTLEQTSAISLVYWTLATELQFYLFVLAMAVIYRFVQINYKLPLLFTVSVLGFIGSVYWNYNPMSETWVLWQAQLPALLLEFCLGVLVYRYLQLANTRKYQLLLLTIGLSLLFALYLIYPSYAAKSLSARPFAWFNLASALGYALVMAALLQRSRTSQPKQNTTTAYLIYAGGLSYSIYLFHEITIRWAQKITPDPVWRVVIGILIVCTLAWALNRWIENPLREYGRR